MKTYHKPETEILPIELEQMVALSVQTGDADPSSPILVKENEHWDIWGQ